MRHIVLTCIALTFLGFAPAQADALLSPAQFRDQIAKALQGLGPDLCVQSVDDFTLHFGQSQADCTSQLNIDNGYRDYAADPANLNVIVQRYMPVAQQILSGSIDNGNERKRVVIVLRSRDYLQDAGPLAASFVTKPFAGDLVAVLMLDSPTTLMSITKERLAQLSLSFDDAYELAARNLRNRVGPVDSGQERGVDIVGAQSALISGTLWLPESCTTRTEERLVLLSSRDSYFATDGRDSEKREFFLGFAQHLITSGQSMSSSVLVCRSGRWVVYGPTL